MSLRAGTHAACLGLFTSRRVTFLHYTNTSATRNSSHGSQQVRSLDGSVRRERRVRFRHASADASAKRGAISVFESHAHECDGRALVC